MGRTGIKPDVKNVGDLFIVRRIVFVAQEVLRIAGEPCIGTFFAEGFIHTIQNPLITERLTGIFINEYRDRHAPCALTRYAPVRTVGDHGMQTVATGFGHKAGFINRLERLFTQVVILHGNEPLRRGAIDDRGLGTPGARIGVLETATRQQCANFDQFGDDGFVGVGFLAVFIIDALARKHRNGRVIGTVTIHHFRNFQTVFQTGLVIVRAVGRCGMDKAGTGVGRNVISCEKRYVKVIALTAERMGGNRAVKVRTLEGADNLVTGDATVFAQVFEKVGTNRHFLANGGPCFFSRFGDFDHRIFDFRTIGNCAVTRNGPRGGGPDDDGGVFQDINLGLGDREAHMNGLGGMVVIFDFGLGKGGLFDHRPHNRLGTHIERPVHQEFAKFTGNRCLGLVIHGDIGVVPVTHHAKTFEFFALDIKPFLGELAAFLAKFGNRNIILVLALGAILFFDFPFNRKTVAIPARNVNSVLAQHLLGTGDDVFQDFVQRMTDMQMAVRIGGAIMQDKHFTVGRNTANFAIEVLFLPLLEQGGLHLWQTRPHREIGLGQDNGFLVFDTHRDGPVVLNKLKGRTPGESAKSARIIAGSSTNSNLAENLFGCNHISRNLGLKGIKPVELLFAPDKAVQTDPHVAIIDVLIEVKQVCFEPGIVIAAKAWPYTNIGDSGHPAFNRLPIRIRNQAKFDGINPEFRTQVIAKCDIGRREADRPTTRITMGNNSGNFPRTPQKVGGVFGAAFAQGLTDGGRRINDPVIVGHSFDRGHAKSGFLADGTQQIDIACPALAKAEIPADHHMFDAKSLDQNAFDEFFGTHGGEFAIELGLVKQIDIDAARSGFAILGRGQAKWRIIGTEQHARMGLECQDRKRHTEIAGNFACLIQKRLMPQMQTVKIADRHNSAARLIGQVFKRSKNAHPRRSLFAAFTHVSRSHIGKSSRQL